MVCLPLPSDKNASDASDAIERVSRFHVKRCEEIREQVTADTGALVAQVLQLEGTQQHRSEDFEAFREESTSAHQDLEGRALNMIEALQLQQMDATTEQGQMKHALDRIPSIVDGLKKNLSDVGQNLEVKLSSVEELAKQHLARLDSGAAKSDLKLDETSRIAERADARVDRWDRELAESMLQVETTLDGIRERAGAAQHEILELASKQDDDQRTGTEAATSLLRNFGSLAERLDLLQSDCDTQLRDVSSESQSQFGECRARIHQTESALNRLQLSQEQTVHGVDNGKQRMDQLSSTVHELEREIAQCGLDLTRSIDAVTHFRQDTQQSIESIETKMTSSARQIIEVEESLDRKIIDVDSLFGGVARAAEERHEQAMSLFDQQAAGSTALRNDMQSICGNVKNLTKKFGEHQAKLLEVQSATQAHVQTSVADQDKLFTAKADAIRDLIEESETRLSDRWKHENERAAAGEARAHEIVKATKEALEQQVVDQGSGHSKRLGRLEAEMNSRFLTTIDTLETQVKRTTTLISKLEEDTNTQIAKTSAKLDQELSDSRSHYDYELEKLGSQHSDSLHRTRSTLEQQIGDSTNAVEFRLHRLEKNVHDGIEKHRSDTARVQSDVATLMAQSSESWTRQLEDRSTAVDKRIKEVEATFHASTGEPAPSFKNRIAVERIHI